MILRLLSAITAAIFLALPGCPARSVSPAIPAPLVSSSPDIQVVTLPQAKVGQPYQFQLNAKGGKPPLIWSVIKGALPPGLNLLVSGRIIGIPTAAGKFSATVQVRDQARLADQATLTFSPEDEEENDLAPTLINTAWHQQKPLPCRKYGPKHSEIIVSGNTGCGGGEISGPITIVIGPPPSVSPTITGVSPAFGDIGGGTAVTISGTNFQAGALPSFDTSLCSTPVTVNSTTVTCSTPAHAAAIVDVSIVNPDGGTATLPGSYTYEVCVGPCVAPAPDITSVNPATGSTSGGDTVNVRGHNFRAGATVSFGGSSSTVNSIAYNLISVTTPAHAAGAVNVVVTNSDATSATCTSCFTFQVGVVTSGNVLFGNGWNVFSHPFPGAQGQSAGAVRTWDAGLGWDQIETSNGVFNFTLFDKWLGAAQTHSAKILLTMGHTPKWANGGAGSCIHHTPWSCTPPSDIGSGDNFWKGFVTGVKNHVTSWNGTHSPHVTVDFEVWNEPDGGFWSGSQAQLLTLQVDAYNILHPAGYLTGTPAPQGNSLDTYLGSYLAQSGACSHADFVDYHPYLKSPVETSVPTMVQKVKAIMVAHGCGSLPLRGTEFAWPGISTSSLCDQTMQAAIMARHHLLQWSNGVAELYWYQWDNTVNGTMWSSASGSCGAPAGTHQDGTAWGTLMLWLPSGSKALGAAKVSSAGDWTLQVTRPGKPDALIGWHPSGAHAFTTPSPYTNDWYDFLNSKHTGAATSLNDNPILMESGTVPVSGVSYPADFFNTNLLSPSDAQLPPQPNTYAVRLWDGICSGVGQNRLYPTVANGGCLASLVAKINSVRTNLPGIKLHLAVGQTLSGGALPVDYQAMLNNLCTTTVSGGSVIAAVLESFEPWNEVTTTQGGSGTGLTPAAAAQATKMAHTTLKACAPSIKITSPSFTETNPATSIDLTYVGNFITALKALSGGLGNIDVWNGHGYLLLSTCGNSSTRLNISSTMALNMMAGFRTYLNGQGESAKNVWWTEGMNLNVAQCSDSLHGGNTSAAAAIAAVRQIYLLARATGKIDRVYQYAWDNGQTKTPPPFAFVCGTDCGAGSGSTLSALGSDYINHILPDLAGATNVVVQQPPAGGTAWTVFYKDSSLVNHTVTWNTATSPNPNLP